MMLPSDLRERQDGWYHVRWLDKRDSRWQIAEYGEGRWFHWKYSELPENPFEIGPRILSPDEHRSGRTGAPLTIYIVWGDNGEPYEDHREWAVCGFTDLEAAKQHAAAAAVRMREIAEVERARGYSRAMAQPNEFDPFGLVYIGASVTYVVGELELRGTL